MAIFKLLSIILLIYNVEAGIYDLFKPEMRLVGFVIEKISPIGIQMCVKKCSKRVSCASVNFNRAQMDCELSYSDATSNPASVTSDPGYIYLERNKIPQEYFDACSASCPTSGSCVNAATGPKCIKTECPVHHPDANLTNVKVTSTSIGTTLPYTCHWNKSMTLNSTCKADGTWTSSASICPTGPTDCFDTHDSCWYQFNFTYDTAFNGCPDGDRFVRRTKYSSAPFVGVVLCSPTRYKILLGASLTGTFLNVGDGAGQGEDLCELVGGLVMNAYLPRDYTNASEMTGYARGNWGEEFQLQPIAGGTRRHCNSWYECGVQIPGTPEPDCMSATPPCWYSYNVWLDNSCNSCNGCSGGQIFVKRTNYTSAPFLAVQLCSSTMYKLFLGSSLGGKFMHIADVSGNGKNHCELVGGSELSASTGTTTLNQLFPGYYRYEVGEQFKLGYSDRFPNYYECGVSIPGTDIVV
uniref:Uncharacterized protein LOC111103759 isoform X3 n=1 Tax=Crassostrea virginica TaxID=6565 RepID=A0A8B8AP15_CRAVI|nr:uncharacterized protein LOC111103759 isoform X3 [Crassostrea virginica]